MSLSPVSPRAVTPNFYAEINPPAALFRVTGKEYALSIEDRMIQISENGSLVAVLLCYSPEKVRFDRLSYVYNNRFYFCLAGNRDKDLYVFNSETECIDCLQEGLKDPHFFEDRLVEFGSGCNEKDLSQDAYEGEIRILDLSSHKMMQHSLPPNQSGWICSIDRMNKTIVVNSAFSNQSLEISLLSTEESYLGPLSDNDGPPSPILNNSDSESTEQSIYTNFYH